MRTLNNYNTVNADCYKATKTGTSDDENGIKDRIEAVIYPLLGIMGIYYQIYLLLSL